MLSPSIAIRLPSSFLFFFLLMTLQACSEFIQFYPLVEFMDFVFTRRPGESYRRRLRSLLLYLCYVFPALINSTVCWLGCFHFSYTDINYNTNDFCPALTLPRNNNFHSLWYSPAVVLPRVCNRRFITECLSYFNSLSAQTEFGLIVTTTCILAVKSCLGHSCRFLLSCSYEIPEHETRTLAQTRWTCLELDRLSTISCNKIYKTPTRDIIETNWLNKWWNC